MINQYNLDIAALRTLLAAVDLKGFRRAAESIHRTPGAVSLQMKALEERVGQELFRKVGRSQVLTDAGEALVAYARRLVNLNDEAVEALAGLELDGQVRFGMPQDFADNWLALALTRFSRAHPGVRVDIRVDRNTALLEGVARGDLDLALAFSDGASGAIPMARMPVRWLVHPEFSLPADAPVPLLLLEQPCVFRKMAIAALDKARRPWRVALTSASLSALWAAAEAGMGVTVRSAVHIPPNLQIADKRFKLPALRKMDLLLLQNKRSNGQPAVEKLRGIVEEVIRARLRA